MSEIQITKQTQEQEELNAVLEEATQQMDDADLGVEDWELSVEGELQDNSGKPQGGELWANVWFDTEPEDTLDRRRERAMEILEETLADHDTCLPSVVNANNEVDCGDTGIAYWWSL